MSWYVMAARWGNNEAIVQLGKMGVTIPTPDLLHQQQRNGEIATSMMLDSLNSSAYTLGCAVTGGSCTTPGDSPANTTSPVLTNSNQTNTINSGRINTTNPSVLSDSLESCTSDYSCGIGFRCIKESYKNTGTCLRNVNEYGTQTFDSPNPSSIGVNTGQGCMTSSCPIGFRCDIATKACIK